MGALEYGKGLAGIGMSSKKRKGHDFKTSEHISENLGM